MKEKLNGQMGLNGILVILVIFSILTGYFLYQKQVQLKESTEPFPATSNDYVNEIIGKTKTYFDSSLNYRWQYEGCTIPPEKSLVNLIHIKKQGDNYEINCEFGPSYDLINYELKDGSKPLVYLGWVRDRRCDEEVAKILDKAAREYTNCANPTSTPLEAGVTDYYIYNIVCRKLDEYPDNPIVRDTLNHICFYQIENKSSIYSGSRGIIPTKE